ncbi:MazG family protein [Deinococcus sp.]|uniref:MazG family protein n=1 Tax=Deinococcus sp. TaxID=47478 RepID=UPI0025C5B006|nr:MazG family protein [Deinococcus sp.]
MQDLLTIMRRLRAPDGCPWDQEQTHESLRPYLLEEAAEASDAAGSGDPAALRDELGDVLLQVAFHSVIAEEGGTFDYAAVERGVVEKLVRRHPHVFGEVLVQDSTDVMRNWQEIKAQERGGRSRPAEDRVPAALGALARESKTQKLAGIPSGVAAAARAAVAQAATQAPDTAPGVADVLAAVVTWARSAGVDPELALRDRSLATLRALPDQGSEP